LVKHPVAFGTFRLQDKCTASVLHALKEGYRVIDTACSYKSHAAVGIALEQAIRDGICRRDEVVIITKICHDTQARGSVAITQAMEQALMDLRTPYVDVVLLHRYEQQHWENAWVTLESFMDQNICRHIGVSNFYTRQLETMRASPRCTIQPFLNQIEITPFHFPAQCIAYCKQHNIMIQSHSPLTKGEKFIGKHKDVKLIALAESEHTSPAELLLGWLAHHEILIAVRSSNLVHIQQNLNPKYLPSEKAMHALDCWQASHTTHPQLRAYNH